VFYFCSITYEYLIRNWHWILKCEISVKKVCTTFFCIRYKGLPKWLKGSKRLESESVYTLIPSFYTKKYHRNKLRIYKLQTDMYKFIYFNIFVKRVCFTVVILVQFYVFSYPSLYPSIKSLNYHDFWLPTYNLKNLW